MRGPSAPPDQPSSLALLLDRLPHVPEPEPADRAALDVLALTSSGSRVTLVLRSVSLEVEQVDVRSVVVPADGSPRSAVVARVELAAPLTRALALPSPLTDPPPQRRPFAFSSRGPVADHGDWTGYERLEDAYLRRHGLRGGPDDPRDHD